MNKNSPIGIFDSGLGGISVLSEIHSLLPNEDLLFFGDSKYNPYGTKTTKEIETRCLNICDWMQTKDVKAIVIACNTATSACVPKLRDTYSMDIIGMEPALKVASELGKHQRIAVWATDYTLREKKFANLMQRFDSEHTIYRVPCPKLVELVEDDRLDQKEQVDQVLEEYLSQAPDVDSVVLGCTHFVFFRSILEKKVGSKIHIVDGNAGTARHLKEVLEEKNLLNDRGGRISWCNTDDSKLEMSKQLLKRLEESECHR